MKRNFKEGDRILVKDVLIDENVKKDLICKLYFDNTGVPDVIVDDGAFKGLSVKMVDIDADYVEQL